ncbi:phosphoglycerate mutase-like protein 4 [Cryptomeria japonica]|uniref:phosphoglycerate mutase-like protein 4 n=1 Tax=Cryptomeria japonica TaxID=3369 RepID=UPI0025AC3F39|nr:phosphoglycerate mutase-like protein 4 [Cryptomeria japonica]XP_057827780.1 phosphoglycerate mutase-like protein 4 [Cryptomeria japonica]XP_057827781.1 phosphoglycerate mutase-like protein 4 [Cryptomeria japonica]XP_057827782.1 phosphoglycerate mutase-like protein 4 [Cryptomeria japonica]XP_057827783.1 phosphoglycerate mutase-like protein 4 [Cryptomeria japonica]XP_057827784.1 phosphoglycerate mutase-like protein 4 [Cryptomeria japonica]XP_057827785.1 phosphoglycerate mutase-like protein 4
MDCNCPDENASMMEESQTTEVILVRHGETTWNFGGILQGQLESELDELGWRQAKAVAERLAKEPKISALHSSDLKRALDTATTIAEKCSLQVIKNSAWRERHLGKLQGLSRREAPVLEPTAFQAFTSHEEDQTIPGGGESLNEFYDRTTSALEEIGKNHRGERVVVVTHGGVIRMLLNFAAGKSTPGIISNASINVIRKHENGAWFVHSWGDKTHLNGVGVLNSGFGGDRESG